MLEGDDMIQETEMEECSLQDAENIIDTKEHIIVKMEDLEMSTIRSNDDDNDGIVDDNNGIVDDNDGIVDDNDGIVDDNDGTVDDNDGIVDDNDGIDDDDAIDDNNNDGIVDGNDNNNNDGSDDNDDEEIYKRIGPPFVDVDIAARRKSKAFFEKWMKHRLFKDWLRPCEHDRRKAKCLACDKVLVVGVSELKKHAQAMKHELAMMHFKPDSDIAQLRQKRRYSTQLRNGGKKFVSFDNKMMTDSVVDDTIATLPEGNSEDDGNSDDNGVERLRRRWYHRSVGRKRPTNSQTSFINAAISGDNRQAVVGKPAPFWRSSAFVNGHLSDLKLTDFKNHYLIMMFYPHIFDQLSSDEICKVNDNIMNFRERNTEVVVCSVDSSDTHTAWLKSKQRMLNQSQWPHLHVSVLFDTSRSIAELYGCYSHAMGCALRANYIVDRRGIIRHASVCDLPIGRSLIDMYRLLDTIRLVDDRRRHRYH